MVSTIGKWGFACLLLGALGCSHASQLERVRDLDGVKITAAPEGWKGATVTLDSFEDDRPSQAWSTGYARVQYEHPEHANAFSESGITRVGSLEEEYPALLARSLPPGAQVSLGAAGASEFVVRGRLLQSTLSYRAHPFMALPGLVGIPVAHSNIHFRVAVELYQAGNPKPIWSQTYAFDEKRVEGLYYGSDGTRDLAKEALRDSVGRAAADITAVISARRIGTEPS